MNESSSEIAGSGKLAWWRRVILFVLEVNPPWWGQAGVWALAVMLVFLTGLVGSVNDARRGKTWVFTLPFEQVGANQWRVLEDRAQGVDAQVEVYTKFAFAHQWRVAFPGAMRGESRGPSGAPRNITEPEARSIVRDALARLGPDEFRSWAEKSLELPNSHDRFDRELWMQVVYEGRAEAFSGSRFWWYLARQSDWLSSIALIGFLLCFVVGFLRAVQRRTYEPSLALIARGRCPKCRYDMTGAPARVCPECGTDVDAVEREARRALE